MIYWATVWDWVSTNKVVVAFGGAVGVLVLAGTVYHNFMTRKLLRQIERNTRKG